MYVLTTLALLDGWTDRRHQVGHAALTTDTHGHPQGLRDPGGHRDLPVWLGPETPALGRRPVPTGRHGNITLCFQVSFLAGEVYANDDFTFIF